MFVFLRSVANIDVMFYPDITFRDNKGAWWNTNMGWTGIDASSYTSTFLSTLDAYYTKHSMARRKLNDIKDRASYGYSFITGVRQTLFVENDCSLSDCKIPASLASLFLWPFLKNVLFNWRIDFRESPPKNMFVYTL